MCAKVLIVNASPRNDGHISRLLVSAAEVMKSEGCEVTMFNVSTSVYRHCTGCMSCRSRCECALPYDDAHQFAQLLRDNDIIIFGIPCYWGGMPGQLKGLFDRAVYAMIADGKGLRPQPLLRGKRAMAIVTSTTPWPWNRLFGQTSGTVRALRSILRYSGIRLVATMHKGDTHRHPGITPRDLRRLHHLLKSIMAL